MARQLVFANWDHMINQEQSQHVLRDLWVSLSLSLTGLPWEDLPDAFNSFGHEWGFVCSFFLLLFVLF